MMIFHLFSLRLCNPPSHAQLCATMKRKAFNAAVKVAMGKTKTKGFFKDII